MFALKIILGLISSLYWLIPVGIRLIEYLIKRTFDWWPFCALWSPPLPLRSLIFRRPCCFCWTLCLCFASPGLKPLGFGIHSSQNNGVLRLNLMIFCYFGLILSFFVAISLVQLVKLGKVTKRTKAIERQKTEREWKGWKSIIVDFFPERRIQEKLWRSLRELSWSN